MSERKVDVAIIGAGERVNFSMVWNTNGDTYDYDIYLFDASFNEIASSTNPSDRLSERSRIIAAFRCRSSCAWLAPRT